MKKDRYSERTLETFGRRLRYLAKYANLGSPESVKEFIAKKA
jgi:ribosomal protein S15P/S13E